MEEREYEISIKLLINGCLLKKLPTTPTSRIFYFADDLRFVDGVGQIKKVTHSRYFIKRYKDVLFPCIYTEATETPTTQSIESKQIQSHVSRFILKINRHIRISIDYENYQYYLKGEIENCRVGLQIDHFLMEYYSYWIQYNQNTTDQFDNLPVNLHNQITSRVFKNCVLDPPNVHSATKYKYDGYRGKFVIKKNNEAEYSDSLNKYAKITDLPASLGKYVNLIVHVEVMEKCFIMTDLMAIIKQKTYSFSPLDVTSFFASLDSVYGQNILIDEISTTLFFQRPIEDGVDIPIDKHDGCILISDEYEYKFKLPTCDVSIKSGFLYLDDDSKNHLTNHRFRGYKDGIYEIENFNELKVMRMRPDRHHTSTREEYEEFLVTNRKWKSLNPLFKPFQF
jgi:hypothetical protein